MAGAVASLPVWGLYELEEMSFKVDNIKSVKATGSHFWITTPTDQRTTMYCKCDYRRTKYCRFSARRGYSFNSIAGVL